MEISVLKYISNLDRHYEILFNNSTNTARVILIPPDEESGSEPLAGTVVYSACEGTTLDKVIYDGGNRVHYEGVLNSPTCGYIPPDPEDPEPEVPVTYSSTKQYTVTCPTNYAGSYTATATMHSTLSQVDADNKALNEAKRIATENVVCTLDLQFEDVLDAEEDDGFTISYTPELKSWSSFHDYRPTLMLSNGNDVLVFSNELVHDINVGTPNKYFDDHKESSIRIVFNKEPLITKVFDNLLLQTSDIFDKITCGTTWARSNTKDMILVRDFDYDDTDEVVICKYKNSQYQLPIPRDIDEARFRDKFIEVVFVKRPYIHFLVKYVTMLFRVNAR